MRTENYIKFTHDWQEKAFDLDEELFGQFVKGREKLMAAGLMGGAEGIGFGNMSVRSKDQRTFVITGTGAGLQPEFLPRHMALVTDYAFDRNFVRSIGLTPASSESLSHAAIYQALPDVQAVVHVHHKKFWTQQLNKLPTTSTLAEFGTVELARALYNLSMSQDVRAGQMIVMGGHPEGIIAFGSDLLSCIDQLIENITRSDL